MFVCLLAFRTFPLRYWAKAVLGNCGTRQWRYQQYAVRRLSWPTFNSLNANITLINAQNFENVRLITIFFKAVSESDVRIGGVTLEKELDIENHPIKSYYYFLGRKSV